MSDAKKKPASGRESVSLDAETAAMVKKIQASVTAEVGFKPSGSAVVKAAVVAFDKMKKAAK